MLVINDAGSLSRALASSVDDRLKWLLNLRRVQLGGDIKALARFIIVGPDDALDALEQVLSFSVFQNPVDGCRFGDPDFSPGWEWIEDHGFAYEIVFIFDDSGFAHVIMVGKDEGVDTTLLAFCAAFASEHV